VLLRPVLLRDGEELRSGPRVRRRNVGGTVPAVDERCNRGSAGGPRAGSRERREERRPHRVAPGAAGDVPAVVDLRRVALGPSPTALWAKLVAAPGIGVRVGSHGPGGMYPQWRWHRSPGRDIRPLTHPQLRPLPHGRNRHARTARIWLASSDCRQPSPGSIIP